MTSSGERAAYSTEGTGLEVQGNNAYPPASAPLDANNQQQQQQIVYMQPPQQQLPPKIVYVDASGQVVNDALQQQYSQQQQQQYIQQPQVFAPQSNLQAIALATATAAAAGNQNWQQAPNFTPVQIDAYGRGHPHQISCCGSNIAINDKKRIPSSSPNHCNKIFLWINTFCFIWLWVLFPEFQAAQTSSVTYCDNTYPEVTLGSSSYSCSNTTGCVNDNACIAATKYDVNDNIMCVDYGDTDSYYYSSSSYDCQCCGSALFIVIAIIFYVLLGINTLRTVVFTLLCGMCKVDRKQTYEINESTGHVKLKAYMDYICDTPALFLITICYSDVRRAMNEAISYGITFPTTRFLVHNVLLQNVPIGVLCAYFVLNNGKSNDENIMFILEVIFAGVGFLSNIYRWQQINRIEKYNMLNATTV